GGAQNVAGGTGLTTSVFVLPHATSVRTLALAATSGFLAFAGFESAGSLGEESLAPRRAIRRAIVTAVSFGRCSTWQGWWRNRSASVSTLPASRRFVDPRRRWATSRSTTSGAPWLPCSMPALCSVQSGPAWAALPLPHGCYSPSPRRGGTATPRRRHSPHRRADRGPDIGDADRPGVARRIPHRRHPSAERVLLPGDARGAEPARHVHLHQRRCGSSPRPQVGARSRLADRRHRGGRFRAVPQRVAAAGRPIPLFPVRRPYLAGARPRHQRGRSAGYGPGVVRAHSKPSPRARDTAAARESAPSSR